MAIDKNTQILVVDDNQGVRQIIADVLRAIGMRNLLHAENGKIAWRKLNEERPALILLDWDMPVMTGYEFLSKVRSHKGYDDIPIIMLTAHNEKDDVLQAVTAGANDYIIKPFAPDTLYAKLEKALGDTIN